MHSKDGTWDDRQGHVQEAGRGIKATREAKAQQHAKRFAVIDQDLL